MDLKWFRLQQLDKEVPNVAVIAQEIGIRVEWLGFEKEVVLADIEQTICDAYDTISRLITEGGIVTTKGEVVCFGLEECPESLIKEVEISVVADIGLSTGRRLGIEYPYPENLTTSRFKIINPTFLQYVKNIPTGMRLHLKSNGNGLLGLHYTMNAVFTRIAIQNGLPIDDIPRTYGLRIFEETLTHLQRYSQNGHK